MSKTKIEEILQTTTIIFLKLHTKSREKIFTNLAKIITYGINIVSDTYVHNLKKMFLKSQQENLTPVVQNRYRIVVKLSKTLIST